MHYPLGLRHSGPVRLRSGAVLFHERVAHFGERGILELADALTGDTELTAYIFQEHWLEAIETEAAIDDPAFALVEDGKKTGDFPLKILVG